VPILTDKNKGGSKTRPASKLNTNREERSERSSNDFPSYW
jgi:hypothetical protein